MSKNTPQPVNEGAVHVFVEAIKGITNWASSYAIDKRLTIGRIVFRFTLRRADGYMGRFGGGWNWKLGIQASSLTKDSWTMIISLLVAELRIQVKP